jgi:hypothetical protein
MLRLIYSPQWFYGEDIAIDIVAIVVLSLIAFFALKFYKINKNKNYKYIAVSFILLAFSFLFKILTNFSIYFIDNHIKKIGFVTITYQTLQSTDTLFFIGFLAYRLLTLIGLYLLYAVYDEKKSKASTFIIFYLIVISTYFSHGAYYIFHLTSLILLALITSQYARNYKQNKKETTRLLKNSFGLIAVSQILFIFVGLDNHLYVAAEAVQLIGYAALLITFVKVLTHGKKTG